MAEDRQVSTTDPARRKVMLKTAGRIKHKAIVECSGIAYTGGAFWTHNDSGGEAVLYRSRNLDFSDAEVLDVPGAENVDWEDLAVMEGDILVCDIGDNARKRETIRVYRVRYVPAAQGQAPQLKLIATYPIRYPDGAHDAEAALVIDRKLYIVAKRHHEPATTLFMVEDLRDVWEPGGMINWAVAVATLDLDKGEQVTSAAYNPGAGKVVLLTYHYLYVYGRNSLGGPPQTSVRIQARQCEAVCFKGTQLIIANEQRGVYAIDDFLTSVH